MDIKLKGVVKHSGKWKKPGEVIRKVDDEIAEDLITQGYAEEVDPLPDEDANDLQELRDRAKLLSVSNAGRLGKDKLESGIAEKEAELRMKAAELEIEGADEKSIEDLLAAIAEAEKK